MRHKHRTTNGYEEKRCPGIQAIGITPHWQPVSAFYHNAYQYDKLSTVCRICTTASKRFQRQQRREHYQAYQNRPSQIYARLRCGAIERGIIFNLTKDEFIACCK